MSANQNWGPADVATLREATAGLRWTNYDGSSAELEAEGKAHNERVAKVVEQLRASLSGFETALGKITEGCEPKEYGELFAAVEAAKIDRTSLMTELAALWANRIILADKLKADFEKKLPAAEAEYETAVARIKGELTRIGSGIDAMPAHASNGDTAERQLEYRARFENVHSRKAAADVQQIRGVIDAAAEQRRASREGQATALKFIRTTARKMLYGAA